VPYSDSNMTNSFVPRLIILGCVCLAGLNLGTEARAQTPVDREVRQIVTFSFLPGQMSEALRIYRDEAIPIYRETEALISFRGFGERESPVPLDLMIVSAFNGMAGMDNAGTQQRKIAELRGTSIGAIYGRLGALTSGHTDQFIEMLPALGAGDASSRRLTAFVWYRLLPGRAGDFEYIIEHDLVPWEVDNVAGSATGRFLLSDGWDYLRMLAFDSLGDYQEYWSSAEADANHSLISRITVERREVLVSSMSDFSIR